MNSSLWTLDLVMDGNLGWTDQSTLANSRPCKVPEDLGQRVGQSSIPPLQSDSEDACATVVESLLHRVPGSWAIFLVDLCKPDCF